MTEDRLPLEIHELRSSPDKPLSPLKRSHKVERSWGFVVLPIAAPTPIPLSDAQPSSPYAAMMAIRKPAPPKQLKQKEQELARPVSPPPAVREELDYDGPEWSIIEDQALLTAVRNEEIMCHSFGRLKTSLRYNWEYISGFVNRVTRFYRSPRQCSIRYQTVVRPRESGQLMVVDPLSRRPRKVPLTSAEVVHLRKGRATTDLQYGHDAESLREVAVLGKLRLVDSLVGHQNESKELRRSNSRPLDLSGRLPSVQESLLSSLSVRYATAQYPDVVSQVINNLEERRIIQETAKKKLAELQTNNERPNLPPHPVISVCVRPPAVPVGPDIVQSRIPIVVAVPQLMLQNPNAVQSSMTQDLSTFGGEPDQGAIISYAASTAGHPSSFSKASGATVKRQLFSQSPQLATTSRASSPQIVAQVLVAPLPQPLSGEPPSPAPQLPFTQSQTEELPQEHFSP
ncbi:unnamed protein product [Angiostrongylus costaricensis]|uniref:Myb-like domain-containing protein n=1 Tax=Angiostrongylus costaricensis TaxID=334426 RepID=A0A0R3PC25_ANGCS|nr:unnamed protein product [Angiostrongylus costaricensis]